MRILTFIAVNIVLRFFFLLTYRRPYNNHRQIIITEGAWKKYICIWWLLTKWHTYSVIISSWKTFKNSSKDYYNFFGFLDKRIQNIQQYNNTSIRLSIFSCSALDSMNCTLVSIICCLGNSNYFSVLLWLIINISHFFTIVSWFSTSIFLVPLDRLIYVVFGLLFRILNVLRINRNNNLTK